MNEDRSVPLTLQGGMLDGAVIQWPVGRLGVPGTITIQYETLDSMPGWKLAAGNPPLYGDAEERLRTKTFKFHAPHNTTNFEWLEYESEEIGDTYRNDDE